MQKQYLKFFTPAISNCTQVIYIHHNHNTKRFNIIDSNFILQKSVISFGLLISLHLNWWHSLIALLHLLLSILWLLYELVCVMHFENSQELILSQVLETAPQKDVSTRQEQESKQLPNFWSWIPLPTNASLCKVSFD
ncbi:hypothetical protein J3Q64DRAFT_1720525 [Phycomyces blakesleeanus]|uniref:Copper transporter n=1 Tax=Phycomyces blakesleeanus TaxID=4837 RepID=A0ABR3BD60_PHYBL